MGRWPGSNLYFKAKVVLVRDEDNEYDVEFSNGTVFTLKAKDVYKDMPKRGRSKSRGRGEARAPRTIEIESASEEEVTAAPAEEAPVAPAEEAVAVPVEEATAAPVEEVVAPVEAPVVSEEVVDAAEPVPIVEPEIIAIASPIVTAIKTTVRTSMSSIKSATKKVLAEEKPSRSSKRIAAKMTADAYSDDEGASVKPTLAPNPELPDAHGYKKKKNWHLADMLMAIIFMVGTPTVLVALHTVCGPKSCTINYEVPKLSTDYKSYLDIEALKLVLAFSAVLVSINFLIMGTIIAATVSDALVGLALSYWAKKSNLNKQNTGNIIVDFYNGREMNPRFLGMDLKLICFRFSMITLALLNVVLVLNDIIAKKTTFDLAGLKAVNPTIVIAAAFQIFFALDAMFFEEHFFHSHDAMNSGYGLSMINSYATFPFLPTLITKYLIARSPHVAWYYLAGIVLVKLVGYVIFRSTEVQRCEFAKDPNNPALAHLETMETSNGRKIPVSGWWSIVRYPNYLGDFLIQWR